ncbi:hypothetical protein [Streptomyces sp. NPDC050600]|uniref:hypothetical protein n=1 Tax=Streptomyces sp. NPDC050600 TaxID=3157213 RepID=UPI00341501BE
MAQPERVPDFVLHDVLLEGRLILVGVVQPVSVIAWLRWLSYSEVSVQRIPPSSTAELPRVSDPPRTQGAAAARGTA